MKESPNLDLLRATAVLFVLASHALRFLGLMNEYPSRWMGWLGVMFFFVHTSLVLMQSLERQQPMFDIKGLVKNFYIRRVFRIYPLSILVLLLLVSLHIPSQDVYLGRFYSEAPEWKDIVANLLLVQNLSPRISILGVLWSLPYELQMYVFLPFLFFFTQRIRSATPLFLLWMGLVAAAVLRADVTEGSGWVARLAVRLSLLQFAPHFFPGVIAYYLSKRTVARLPNYTWPCFLFLLTAGFFWRPSWQMGWVTCLLLGCSIPHFREQSNRLIRVSTHLIAKYSYGIYLCHLLCLWLAFVQLAKFPMAAQVIAFCFLMAAIPALLYHTIEEPFIRIGTRIGARFRAA